MGEEESGGEGSGGGEWGKEGGASSHSCLHPVFSM